MIPTPLPRKINHQKQPKDNEITQGKPEEGALQNLQPITVKSHQQKRNEIKQCNNHFNSC